MRVFRIPLIIIMAIFMVLTTGGVFATWYFANGTATSDEKDSSVFLNGFVYSKEVAITNITTVSSTAVEMHDFSHPTKAKAVIDGQKGQKIVYKVEAHNYSEVDTYVYTGALYDKNVYEALNNLTISVSTDSQNQNKLNEYVYATAHQGTPIAPGEDFVFYITYTLTDAINNGEIMVDYVFKPIIYSVTYLDNNETYAIEHVTDNTVEYTVRTQGPQSSNLVFAGWVNANAVVVRTIPAKNTNDYTLSASWDNIYIIIFADVNGNVLYQEQFTSSSTKLSSQGQATVDQILQELNAEAEKDHMKVSWSDYDIASATSDITVKAIYAYNGVLNLVPVYEQPDDGIVDYYKVVAVDTLPADVLVPGSVGGVPVRVVERIANTEGENDWNNYASSVKTITIQEGVSRLEWNSLAWTPNLATVKLPSTIVYLAKNTFSRNDLFGNDKKVLTIEFNGTKAEWKAIVAKSDSKWDGGLRKGSKVLCTDGYFEQESLLSTSWKEKSY